MPPRWRGSKASRTAQPYQTWAHRRCEYGKQGCSSAVSRPAPRKPAAAGGIFNICTGKETSILNLVESLADVFPDAPKPVFGPSRAGDIYRSVGSAQKAKETFGFEAQTALFDGMRLTAEWMKR